MPRLIPPELGNGKRPSDPAFQRSASPTDPLVPVLDVCDDTHELVGEVHAAALDPDDDTRLLTGALVRIDNPRAVDGSVGPISMVIGASTLHEAATEAIGAYSRLALDMPEWVASTDEHLAAVLAEHFTVKGYSTCKAIAMQEVPSWRA